METIDVRAFIDRRPAGSYQWVVVAFGLLVIALDGFDAAIMGYVAPELLHDWHITRSALGPVMSAALIGMAPGALVAGPIADRFGRRTVMLGAVAIFGLGTLLAAFAQTIQSLVVLRFLTGLGLGASVPTVGTLVAEYAPAARRSMLANLAFCGFLLGAAIGGSTAAAIMVDVGWRGILAIGGILPLVLIPFIAVKVSESPSFLAVRGAPATAVRRIVERIAPGSTSERSTFVTTPRDQRAANPVAMILSAPMRLGTVMLWVAYAMSLFVSFMLGNWLPTMFRDIGFSSEAGAAMTSIYQLGGAVGTVLLGWLIDRYTRHVVLPAALTLGAVAVVLVSARPESPALIVALTLAIGLFIPSAALAINPVAIAFYPTAVRATGANWMHGVGRLGGILSGFVGAWMLASGWSFSHIMLSLTAPLALATLSLLTMSLAVRVARPATEASRAV